jgi:tetratricopeptide (TPR) repeat protein
MLAAMLLAVWLLLLVQGAAGAPEEDSPLLKSLAGLSPQQAVPHLRQMVDLQPNDGLAWYHLGAQLAKLGGVPNEHSGLDALHKAVELLQGALQQTSPACLFSFFHLDGPEKALALFDLAKAYRDHQSEPTTAFHYLTEALAIQPNQSEARVAAARLSLDLLDPEASLRHVMTAGAALFFVLCVVLERLTVPNSASGAAKADG